MTCCGVAPVADVVAGDGEAVEGSPCRREVVEPDGRRPGQLRRVDDGVDGEQSEPPRRALDTGRVVDSLPEEHRAAADSEQSPAGRRVGAQRGVKSAASNTGGAGEVTA